VVDVGKESKKFTQINVSEKTENEIRYTAKILGKSISGFLGELFDAIIQQSVNFKDDDRANLQYLVEYDDVRLRFSGSKIVYANSFKVDDRTTNGEVDTMLRAKTLEQAKREGKA
jgi:hypothetical protein